ncbi:MAG: lysostaphin resistance A-like protein [Dehalococcoidia bacterium]
MDITNARASGALPGPRRLARLLVPLIVSLVLYNNLINLLPRDAHDQPYVPLNLLAGLLLLLLARGYGLSWRDVGLSRTSIPSGLRWGLLLGVGLPSLLFLALLLPDPISSLMEDPRLEGLTLAGLAYRTLIRIPLGTALFEEMAFRGVLFGTWAKVASLRSAVVGSSLLFGLWHITPTFNALRTGDRVEEPALLLVSILAAVVVTFLGGLFFAWLRLRTGGIYGPVLTHWLINALAATAAFIAIN